MSEQREWPEALCRELSERFCNEYGRRRSPEAWKYMLDQVDDLARAHGVTLGAMPVLPRLSGGDQLIYRESESVVLGRLAPVQVRIVCDVLYRWLRDEHGYRLEEER